MTYKIKPVTEEDVDWIVDAAVETTDDSGDKSIFNEEQIRNITKLVVEMGTGLICTYEGERVGVLCGMKNPHPLNPNKLVMFSLFWFVKKRYRHTRVVSMLLNGLKELGQDCDETVLGIPSYVPITDKSLERGGWKLSEKQYIMRNQKCQH